jgi:phasin family protein
MANQSLANLSEQNQVVFASAHKNNSLVVANLEKFVAFQISTLASYVDLSVGRLKAAADIADLEGPQSFYAEQIEVTDKLLRKLLNDGKVLADLGGSFKAELDKLVKESIAELISRTAAPLVPVA